MAIRKPLAVGAECELHFTFDANACREREHDHCALPRCRDEVTVPPGRRFAALVALSALLGAVFAGRGAGECAALARHYWR